MAQLCRKWIKREKFDGLPKRENLEIVEERLPQLESGGKDGKGRCRSPLRKRRRHGVLLAD